MSDDFTPAGPATHWLPAGRPSIPYENGGNRDHSDFEDWRINAKVGITPNATDEYSINYTTQAERAGFAAARQPADRAGLFLRRQPSATGHGRLGYFDAVVAVEDQARRRLVHQDQRLLQHLRAAISSSTATVPTRRSFADSPYDDHSVGGFVEMGTDLIPMNTLEGRRSTTARTSTRNGTSTTTTDGSSDFAGRSPTETSRRGDVVVCRREHVPRDALPRFRCRRQLRHEQVLRAEFTVRDADLRSQPESPRSMPGTGRAPPSSTTAGPAPCMPTCRAAPASRRCSSATAPASARRAVDPTSTPERATNYEIGVSDTFFGDVHVSSAVFYSDIEDSIQNAFFAANGNNSHRRHQRRRRELRPRAVGRLGCRRARCASAATTPTSSATSTSVRRSQVSLPFAPARNAAQPELPSPPTQIEGHAGAQGIPLCSPGRRRTS